MTIVPLEKSISIENFDGSVTNWSKEVFDLLVDIGSINPSEKIITFNLCLMNKVSGIKSYPIILPQNVSFSRFGIDVAVNQKEFDKYQKNKEKIESKIIVLENFITSNTNYLLSNELADDEKAVVKKTIEEKSKAIVSEKTKLSELPIVELKFKKSEDYDTVVREYFTGFNLNEKGKTWLTALAKKNFV